MALPDAPAEVFEGEAELALVIGRSATRVSREQAMDHVFGYVNFIDGSARGLPPTNNVFFQAKSRDGFAPMGPYLVTADEITDPQNLPVKLWVNSALKQDFNTNDMAHDIPTCISWVSHIHSLEPGDVRPPAPITAASTPSKMAIGWHWKSPALVASRSMSATPWNAPGAETLA